MEVSFFLAFTREGGDGEEEEEEEEWQSKSEGGGLGLIGEGEKAGLSRPALRKIILKTDPDMEVKT